ncbi:hypothetical protein MDAP_000241 [Mitosporidium daphniae]
MLKPQTFWEKFFQFYLAIASFFSLLYGLALMVLGVCCRYNPETYGYGFEFTSTLFCLIGGGVMFISILGCCGASCESRRMTISYSLAQSILMTCQLGLFLFLLFSFRRADGVALLIWNDDLSEGNRLSFQNTVKQFFNSQYRCYDDLSYTSNSTSTRQRMPATLESPPQPLSDTPIASTLQPQYYPLSSTSPCSIEFSRIVASWFYFLLLSVGCIMIIGGINLCISIYIFDVFPSNNQKLQHQLEAKRLRDLSA